MPFIAIIGAGPIGGAVAHKAASRDRVGGLRLIDEAESVAQGKALDILQSAPLEGFATRVTASGDLGAAAGAAVIVIADAAATQAEHSGETGLALLRAVSRIDTRAPILFAGAAPRELMHRAVSELKVDRQRMVGSAPFALESALRALAGLAVDASGVEVSLRVLGIPPREAVVGWEEGSVFGQPLSAHLTPHEIAALTGRIPGLWPPGPYALASAAARVAEAIVDGSRRRFSCFVPLERLGVAAMPVELGPDGVIRLLPPCLTRQEQTRLDNALQRGSR